MDPRSHFEAAARHRPMTSRKTQRQVRVTGYVDCCRTSPESHGMPPGHYALRTRRLFCPSEASLAAYADGVIDERNRQRLERHLSECDACLSQVGLLTRLAQTAPPPVGGPLRHQAKQTVGRARSFRPIQWATAGAALVLVAFVVGSEIRRPVPGSRPVEAPRETRGFESPTLTILSPADGATLPAAGGQVTWTAVDRALFYEVRVTDEQGSVLWERRSESPSLSFPTGALRSGARGFIWVAAQLPDNRSVRSRVVGFSVKNP